MRIQELEDEIKVCVKFLKRLGAPVENALDPTSKELEIQEKKLLDIEEELTEAKVAWSLPALPQDITQELRTRRELVRQHNYRERTKIKTKAKAKQLEVEQPKKMLLEIRLRALEELEKYWNINQTH